MHFVLYQVFASQPDTLHMKQNIKQQQQNKQQQQRQPQKRNTKK
jgi:hypothetical protein